MKKSTKFILAVVVIIIAAVAILLSFPDIVDGGKEEIQVDQAVKDVREELGDEIFD